MFYLTLGVMTVGVLVLLALVRESKRGAASAKTVIDLKRVLKARERFDEVVRAPIARGSDLVARMRARVGRKDS